jgi:elongator complex protein 3
MTNATPKNQTLLQGRHTHLFDPVLFKPQLLPLLTAIETHQGRLSQDQLNQWLRQHPKDGSGYFSKSELIAAYRRFAGKDGLKPFDPSVVERIRMKPVRTISGVTPVTVLTKPFPCPGKCIFCPNDVRMPKSYLASEPGAQRAEKNHFDPYLQTYNRLKALEDIGHSVQKAELIVLGGTWSFYPEGYKIWFVKRMFEALNDFGEGIDQRHQIKPSVDVSQIQSANEGLHANGRAVTYNQAITKLYLNQELPKLQRKEEIATWEELFSEHTRNQSGRVRCVGLVLETRPDYISETEVLSLRRLGCTKTQIGLQSLQDDVLTLNKRGHDVAASRRAINLLRQAGLKIHAHWMPNLYGSSVKQDIQDYQTLFNDPDFKPDELKLYPCSLIDDTELMDVYQKGEWQPYTHQELLEVLVACLEETPEYCRLTRVVRDIPSDDIVAGNKFTNFRQIAEAEAVKKKIVLKDIRSREVKNQKIALNQLLLDITSYKTSVSQELFLQYLTKDRRIAGFLRLSLPTQKSFIKELENAAIIREVHVYGQAVNLGKTKSGAPQHLGLGKKLIAKSKEIATLEGYQKLSVISSIGTREYYQKLGFERDDLYQHQDLSK